jgi:hypothetical protein
LQASDLTLTGRVQAHSCAVYSDHKLACWGSNFNGQVQLAAAFVEVVSMTFCLPAFFVLKLENAKIIILLF